MNVGVRLRGWLGTVEVGWQLLQLLGTQSAAQQGIQICSAPSGASNGHVSNAAQQQRANVLSLRSGLFAVVQGCPA